MILHLPLLLYHAERQDGKARCREGGASNNKQEKKKGKGKPKTTHNTRKEKELYQIPAVAKGDAIAER